MQQRLTALAHEVVEEGQANFLNSKGYHTFVKLRCMLVCYISRFSNADLEKELSKQEKQIQEDCSKVLLLIDLGSLEKGKTLLCR